jgi:hypothetical protein
LFVFEIAAGIVLGWLAIRALTWSATFVKKHWDVFKALLGLSMLVGCYAYFYLAVLPEYRPQLRIGVTWLKAYIKLHPYISLTAIPAFCLVLLIFAWLKEKLSRYRHAHTAKSS